MSPKYISHMLVKKASQRSKWPPLEVCVSHCEHYSFSRTDPDSSSVQGEEQRQYSLLFFFLFFFFGGGSPEEENITVKNRPHLFKPTCNKFINILISPKSVIKIEQVWIIVNSIICIYDFKPWNPINWCIVRMYVKKMSLKVIIIEI